MKKVIFFSVFFSLIFQGLFGKNPMDERVLNIIFIVNSGSFTESDGRRNEAGLTSAQKNSIYSNIDDWTKDNFLLYIANGAEPAFTILNSDVNDLITDFEKSSQSELSSVLFDKSKILEQIKAMNKYGIQKVVFHVYAAESYIYDNIIIKSSGINNFINVLPKEILKIIDIQAKDGIESNFEFVFYNSIFNQSKQNEIEKKLAEKSSYYNRGIYLANFKLTTQNLKD
jgi:hypothetical protein